MNEVFKPTKYEGYEVSNLGNVRRVGRGRGFRAGRNLSPNRSSRGYPQVRMTINGVKIVRSVHTLVAEAFLGARPKGSHVRHLDGNKTNNGLNNLAYGTPKENAEDSVRLGVLVRGNSHWSSKINQDQAADCIRRLNSGESPTRISAETGVGRNTVYKIKYGESWAWLRSANERFERRAYGA